MPMNEMATLRARAIPLAGVDPNLPDSDDLPVGAEGHPWRTEEGRELFVWLRGWNRRPAAGRTGP
jgi:hypothetical protein